MATDFVLSFGGTGARVVEALTYVTAAGCRTAPLHVLMIDPDGANGNLSITHKQLDRYLKLNALHDLPATGSAGRPPLFSIPINPGCDTGSLLWEYPNRLDPFKTLIGYSGLSGEHQALIDLLYDEEDLDQDFRVGYVGRAHVGALDLYRTMRDALTRVAADDDASEADDGEAAIDQFFKAVRTQAQSSETRLFVVGSLFGGTGASGIPTVPALLSELLPVVRKDITVGALLLGPYFTFPALDERKPDSALHPLATRAALSHYADTDVGFDSVYFLGAPDRSQTSSENELGGSNQMNKPHYTELAAATAAVHFFTADKASVTGSQVQVFSSGSEDVSWKDMPGAGEQDLAKHLVSFVASMMMQCEFMDSDFRNDRHSEHRWTQKIRRGDEGLLGGRDEELQTLQEFGLRFLEWARGVSETAPSSLMNVPEKVHPPALGAILSGEAHPPKDPYHLFYDELNHADANAQPNAIARYLDVLGQASDRFCAEAYSSRGWSE